MINPPGTCSSHGESIHARSAARFSFGAEAGHVTHVSIVEIKGKYGVGKILYGSG